MAKYAPYWQARQNVMRVVHLTIGTLCIMLAGCSASTAPAQDATLPGYMYHDANHADGVVGASPQAIRSAAQGIWLWPPQNNDWP